MRLLGLDFETTGLDTSKDRIIEVGAVLWENNKPLMLFNWFCKDYDCPLIPEDVTQLNGISNEMLDEFGLPPLTVFSSLNAICCEHQVKYLVAHNGENFDKPILMAELARRPPVDFSYLKSLPWIDTRTDIPFAKEPSSRRLQHIASDLGFINPFPHRAVFDVLTMLRVLSHFSLEDVLIFQNIPFITLQACVTYDQRQLAKDHRFSWEQIGDKKYPKMWVKRIKQNTFEIEKQKYPFAIKEL